MLKVQEYLRSGKTFDDLHNELGIECHFHSTLPLVILNYSQLESPKTNQIVRECRALTLNIQDYSIVAKSMDRFFNWGEMQHEMDLFDWGSSKVYEKVDGSLVLFYYFDGKWMVNTRGSFCTGKMLNEWQVMFFSLPNDFTWEDGILKALGIKCLSELDSILNKSFTYVCEFVSPWNKVVKDYSPGIYHLTCFSGEEEIDYVKTPILFKPIQTYNLSDANTIINYVNSFPGNEFEGCVIKDKNNKRWKFKNKDYLMRLWQKGGDANALWNPKNLVSYILKGEDGELLANFPEVEKVYEYCKFKMDKNYKELETLCEETKHIEDQKEFANAIVGKHPLSYILFTGRRQKWNFKTTWQNSEKSILKVLFDK